MTLRRGDTGDTRTGCAANDIVTFINTNASGVADFELPFGTYRICASALIGTTQRFRQSGASGQPAHPRLSPPSGLVQGITFTIPSSGSGTSGQCSTT